MYSIGKRKPRARAALYATFEYVRNMFSSECLEPTEPRYVDTALVKYVLPITRNWSERSCICPAKKGAVDTGTLRPIPPCGSTYSDRERNGHITWLSRFQTFAAECVVTVHIQITRYIC